MDDLHRLTTLLQEIDEQLASCMRCGMCQAACPLFNETMCEADVARGKLALLDGLATEMIRDAEGVQKKINKCLLCGSCQANCPSGVKVLDIFLKARVILTEYRGLSPIKKLILQGMLSNPELFDKITGFGSKFQRMFTAPTNHLLGTSCSRIMEPVIGNRHFMPLAGKTFHNLEEPRNEARGKSGCKVAFYYGCLVDKMFTDIGQAVLKVFDYHDVGVYMPERFACCGIPALSSGDSSTFERLLDFNIEVLEEESFDYLVTPCATCTSTIKKVWPLFAKDLSPSQKGAAEAISAKTMDIHQFLVDVLKVPALPKTDHPHHKVTYHDPCHLKKSLGVAAQPRQLIQCHPDYEFVELNECDTCCGNGGSFNLQHYEYSEQIGERKRHNVVDSGADVVATGCPACMMQLTDMLSKHGDAVNVKHAIQIYADSLPDKR
jgi:glycolate oxidase iron-sulfur subunit